MRKAKARVTKQGDRWLLECVCGKSSVWRDRHLALTIAHQYMVFHRSRDGR